MRDDPAAVPPAAAGAAGPAAAPSRRSERGLDWFTFFVADVQTGFGPFIAVYLTEQKWTGTDIGLMLSITGIAGLILQIPGGALVDATTAKLRLAALAVAAIGLSALAIAVAPTFAIVVAAQLLHAGGSCVVTPSIAAISLGLVGHRRIGERLGRNARFGAIGNGIAAAVMGAVGYSFSSRSVFFITAALSLPTLWVLSLIRPSEATGAGPVAEQIHHDLRGAGALARNRPLLMLGLCIVLFHFANAAMLPYMGAALTMREPETATALIAACIVVPQAMVAVVSVWVGRRAETWGRRPLLVLGLAALAVRGVLFAFVTNPYVLVAVQLLDGISAATLGVLVPLIAADVTRGTGHFNLALGVLGAATGIGAALSTTFAGVIADEYGSEALFLTLAAVAAAGVATALLLLPETRPDFEARRPSRAASADRPISAREGSPRRS
jgi:MFS family permease